MIKNKLTKTIVVVAVASVIAAIVAIIVNKVTACKLKEDLDNLIDGDDEDDYWDEDYYIDEE